MTVAELDRPTAPLAPFAARVAAESTSAVITLQGEVDVFTLPAVVDVLARVISEHDGPVIVELAETSFIDIGAVRALGRAAQFLADRGRTLTVRRPSRIALRLLAFLGLSDLIRVEPPQHEFGPALVLLRSWSLEAGRKSGA